MSRPPLPTAGGSWLRQPDGGLAPAQPASDDAPPPAPTPARKPRAQANAKPAAPAADAGDAGQED